MSTRTIEVKLFGGPLDGHTVVIPASAESYRVGPFWTYTYAGKDGHLVMFAKRPRARRERRLVLQFVGATGRDPRVQAALARSKPLRYANRRVERRRRVSSRKIERKVKAQA